MEFNDSKLMSFIFVLLNVNTELVCEQLFSWLSRFAAHITEHMNAEDSSF